MNYLPYDKILDKVSIYQGLEPNTLTVRLEGNTGERCPSEMHRYDISLPVSVEIYTINFTAYAPKHMYSLAVNSIDKDSINITFNGKDYIIHEGLNILFEEKSYQASYDGPWFTSSDQMQAVWVK